MAELVCGTGDRQAWLAARREGITATDIAVILGLVTWDSPFALYWRKKGKLPEVEQTDRMRLGTWLETVIGEEWQARTFLGMAQGGLYRSEERPWQLATPDRVVRDGTEEITGVLECKTSATRDGWGDGEQDCEHAMPYEQCSKIPAHVRAQVLWQMDTLGVSTGHVAVCFLPSGEFRCYTLEHDAVAHIGGHDEHYEPCQACRDVIFMQREGERFYRRLLNDDPPPVDGLQVTTDALRHLTAGAVKGKQAEVDQYLTQRYRSWCDQVKLAEANKRECENLIREAMGDATLAVHDGEPVARREVFKRAGYEVGPAEVDRLVRVKPKEGKSDGQDL